jgi:hypothetical protein
VHVLSGELPDRLDAARVAVAGFPIPAPADSLEDEPADHDRLAEALTRYQR